MGAYSSYGWKRFAAPIPDVPYHPQPEPGHLTLANDTRFVERAPAWQQDTAVPALPPEVLDVDEVTPVRSGGGPVFEPSKNMSQGAGFGPGLTNEQSALVREEWVLADDGSVAAHHWSPTTVVDETYYPSDAPPPAMDLYSPQTVDQQYHKGAGSPHSPYATTGRRIKRWTDRHIDYHWWVPEMQPFYRRSGAGTATTPASVSGPMVPAGPYNPPVYATPDRMVRPQTATTPRAWDEPMRVDGTEYDNALPDSWGL